MNRPIIECGTKAWSVELLYMVSLFMIGGAMGTITNEKLPCMCIAYRYGTVSTFVRDLLAANAVYSHFSCGSYVRPL